MERQGGVQRQLARKGPLAMYRATVTGNDGAAAFLLYEFFTLIFVPMPGKAGIWLRRVFLPFLFKGFGRGNVVERDVAFRRPGRISMGCGVTLERGVTLDVKSDDGAIEIRDNVRIGKNVILSCPGGTMVLEQGVRVANNCRLGSLKGLRIGRNAVLGEGACIVGAGHGFGRRDVPIIRQELTCRGETVIGENVVIEQGATLLDGVRIGAGATIRAGSLVTRDIGAGAVAGGVPARAGE